MPLTATYHTLGCKLNFAETASIARSRESKGIQRAKPGEHPDLVIVNTCSVTELADKKSRQYIRSMAKRHPNAKIIVTGCYSQLKSDEASNLPGVSLIAGNDQKDRIADFIDRLIAEGTTQVNVAPSRELRRFVPSCSRGDRTRYFLKVQDGCDYYCTYCTIPIA
ncbi:MAG: tRNA (N(6)-L-threonylcarbamoyladenosine(37)-C(2))-methylthiotransferase MtaB, partial [Muribaculaceae bacterium]|nr:tRNA (N(6)-L-threonylcarbamoyladenosine(37)-C(2))-methylthiotransferase MtaB [Muribaculaceae bacterium]